MPSDRFRKPRESGTDPDADSGDAGEGRVSVSASCAPAEKEEQRKSAHTRKIAVRIIILIIGEEGFRGKARTACFDFARLKHGFSLAKSRF
ncbi:MAG: hypothetical protein LBK08_04310 [Treponema sp.]|jgi:hypothetical protein|nr:hypothetical protein [Treponema sp.]